MAAEVNDASHRQAHRPRDRARGAAAVALGVCLLAAAGVSPALGAPAEPQSEAPTMGDYAPRDFRTSADELGPELIAAVERDLGVSAEEYLARAAAASDASDVVEFLSAHGIDASDRRLDGTQLTIGVDSVREAQLVEQTGAEAVIGSLPPPEAVDDDVVFEAATDVFGGDGITWTNSQGSAFRCSVGVNGTDTLGEPQIVTAGHCTDTVISGGLYRHLTLSKTGVNPSLATDPQSMGAPVPSSFEAGNGFDIGLVRVSEPGLTPQPYVATYGLGQGTRTANLTAVRDTIIPTLGSPVCKSGGTTGWTCGTITNAFVNNQQVSDYQVDVFMTDACMLGGDSGGPALVGNAFVGVNSGSAFGQVPSGYSGTTAQYCASVPQGNRLSVMAIMRHDAVGADTIESRYATTWEPSVLIDRPSVSVPAPHTSGGTITVSGSIANPNPRLRIHVTVNGDTTIVTPNPTTGAWSAALGAVGDVDSLTVQARWGLRSTSPTVTVEKRPNNSWRVLTTTITRIGGADRYAVAIAIAQRAYPITSEQPARPRTVYVVNGGDYPDALSAGPAAAATDGVIMLVPTTTLLPAIRDELVRLGPEHIVIVGGPASVSENVRAAMAVAVPGATVSRVAGADRFEVSRNVLLSTLDGTRVFDGADAVYVANGYNYPDALVAGAAGSSADRRAPVLTVPGPLNIPLPSSTTSAIVNGGYTTIKIAGGPASVTPAIQTQLSNLSGSIAYRLGGLDRYEAARTVANNAYPQTADTVFIATGLNFPDALAGAPLAGMLDAPMYSVPTTCIPRGVLRDLERLRPTEIILLGGTGTLSPEVAALTPCP